VNAIFTLPRVILLLNVILLCFILLFFAECHSTECHSLGILFFCHSVVFHSNHVDSPAFNSDCCHSGECYFYSPKGHFVAECHSTLLHSLVFFV
jgi:hypothetical protein